MAADVRREGVGHDPVCYCHRLESVRRVLGMRCRMQSRERCAHWQFLEQGFTHRAECFYTRCAGCGFLSLPIGGYVGQHIDQGTYYQTRDRYHLAIQGKYRYTVGGQSVIVEPGTLLWFNNKLMHGTENVGDEVRITFVFDVPHHKRNP